MATLGSYTLLAAFIASAYAIAASVAGARRRSPRVIQSGIGAKIERSSGPNTRTNNPKPIRISLFNRGIVVIDIT